MRDRRVLPCKACMYLFPRYCEKVKDGLCFNCIRGIAHACYARMEDQEAVTARMLANYMAAKEAAGTQEPEEKKKEEERAAEGIAAKKLLTKGFVKTPFGECSTRIFILVDLSGKFF